MPLFESLSLFADFALRDGPGQMAADEAVLEIAEQPVLRVYRWSGIWVSFGYSQSLQAIRERFPGDALVRRWTGGGIVEHRGDWTFALIVPRSDSFATRAPLETYQAIHRQVSQALGAAGISCRLALAEEIQPGPACFTAPAPCDIMAGAEKICGGAQRRTRRGFLHQGSIQTGGIPADFGGRLAGGLGRKVALFPLSEHFEDRVRQLAKIKYGSTEWLAKTP